MLGSYKSWYAINKSISNLKEKNLNYSQYRYCPLSQLNYIV